MLHIGHYVYVAKDKIVSIVPVGSGPTKRLIRELRGTPKLIDGTFGRKTESAIFVNSGQVVLSSIQTDTLAKRLQEGG